MGRWFLLVLSALIISHANRTFAQPVIRNGPDYSASNFRVTTFAKTLRFPTSMQQLSDNSILVAVNNPTGGSFFQSTGQLIRLVDANQNGIADSRA